jgi:hypothetical protein
MFHYWWRPTSFTAPVMFISISVVQSGAKKLRIDIAFGGSLTAADVGTSLADFFAVYEVSLEICLLRLFTSWKSSWAVDSTEVLFTTPLYPACALAFSLFSVCTTAHALQHRALPRRIRIQQSSLSLLIPLVPLNVGLCVFCSP